MTKKRTDNNSEQLRNEAESQLAIAPNADLEQRPLAELVQELLVHQIELETQNEQLRQAQDALEESRDRFADLYDFAPIGYLTLTDNGMISQINLTGAKMLGIVRKKLANYRFSRFVAVADRDRWHRHFLNILTRVDTLTCERPLQIDSE